jgi:hypothetical protein
MSVGIGLELLGAFLMGFAVLTLIAGAGSRGFVRMRGFTSSGPAWFVIFMFGAFLASLGVMLG